MEWGMGEESEVKGQAFGVGFWPEGLQYVLSHGPETFKSPVGVSRNLHPSKTRVFQEINKFTRLKLHNSMYLL